MKKKLYELVEKGAHGQLWNLIFDYTIMTLIVLSLISIILESIPEVHLKHGVILYAFNAFSIVIFSIEYIIRLYVSDLTHPSKTKLRSVFRFVFSTYGIIDLFAILPFFLPMFIKIDLRFL